MYLHGKAESDCICWFYRHTGAKGSASTQATAKKKKPTTKKAQGGLCVGTEHTYYRGLNNYQYYFGGSLL